MRMRRVAAWPLLAVAALAITLSSAPGADADQVALGFGYNGSGQLGDSTTTSPRMTPAIAAGGMSDIRQLEVGRYHSLAIRSDGSLWAWGYNAYGQLGDGTTTTRTSPVKVLPHPSRPPCPRVVLAAAGERHSVAVCSNGIVLAWGHGGKAQLGRGLSNTANSSVPVRVTGFPSLGTDCREIISLAAGAYHTLAIDSCNRLYTWGYNSSGQLCDNTTVTKYSPVQPTNLAASTPLRVAAGDYHSFIVGTRPGIDRNDIILACGWNSDGQLGDGSTGSRHFPVLVTGLPQFEAQQLRAIDGGYRHSVFVVEHANGLWFLFTAGYDGSGQMGDGTSDRSDQLIPLPVTGIQVRSAAAGRYHTIASLRESGVRTWGYNSNGQLGDGTNTERHVPVAPRDFATRAVPSVEAGGNTSYILLPD